MIVKVIDYKERADGGADMQVECDQEFTQAAINHYLLFMLYAALDPNNNEYAIKDGEEDE